jgi:hypothetical protein
MKNLQLYRLILDLIRELRQPGEAHIQKIGYFLQDLMGVPLEAEYILYKHGP